MGFDDEFGGHWNLLVEADIVGSVESGHHFVGINGFMDVVFGIDMPTLGEGSVFVLVLGFIEDDVHGNSELITPFGNLGSEIEAH